MLQILDHPSRPSSAVTRRTLLQAGGSGLLGLSLPRVLAAAAETQELPVRAKSVIFLFLFGGPSQLETFDLKPEAPEKIRGPFRPITSRTPGLLIGEHLPRVAQVSDRMCVLRTLSHDFNDHSGGGHYIQTGSRWHIPIGAGFNATPQDWPSMGSVVEHVEQHRAAAVRDLPSYAVVPNSLGRLQEYRIRLRRPGEHAGWLGQGYNPLTTAIDKRDSKDNPYFRDCTDDELNFQIQGLVSPADLTLDRVQRRTSLLEQFDRQRAVAEENLRLASYDRFQQRAISLVTSDRTRQALDLRQEPASLRDRYGRNLFGQSTLLARRLVEAGVRFVTVHYDACDGYSWDSHVNSADVRQHLLPGLDAALSSLILDLEDRGLLDETLVVAMGEMGRTPQANANWGRNHWSTVFPAVLAGAGIRGGSVYGETDPHAAYAVTPPVSPEDLAATIYSALGIDPELRLPDAQGRPVHVVQDGTPLMDLFG